MAMYKDVGSLELVGFIEPEHSTFADGVDFILEKLDAIPEEDVEPVVHAHWIPIVSPIHVDDIDCYMGYKCSKCDREIWINHALNSVTDYPYCHCGAKMDEEK